MSRNGHWLLACILLGCGFKSREITESNIDEITAAISESSLTPGEADLARMYLLRHGLQKRLNVPVTTDSATLPVTVGDAIERQRTYVASQAAREQAEAERSRIAAQARELRQQHLRQQVSASIVAITHRSADYRRREFQDLTVMDILLRNQTNQPVVAVGGEFVLVDALGQEVAQLPVTIERPVPVGSQTSVSLSKTFNQFIEQDQAIERFNPQTGTAVWNPSRIAFADGTIATVDE